MSFELAQFSIVIVGKGHNPTILNPDFLAIRGIVPRAWGWEPAEVLTTPPLSLVRYPIGVSIQMDPQRLQISDLQPGEPPVESKIIPIARAIVETLPNVRYTAVGINFQAIARVESPDRFLKARFLKPGPWDTAEHPVQMAGFRLVYPAPGGGTFLLSLDLGSFSGGDGSERGVIANANFHRDCVGYPSEMQVKSHLDRVPADWAALKTTLQDTLSREET